MKPGPGKISITGTAGDNRQRHFLFLTPVFLCAVITLGSFFHLTNYETLTLDLDIFDDKVLPRTPRNHVQLPPSSLLNLHPFSWLMNNVTLCQLDSDSESSKATRLLPVLVHTTRHHFAERAVLRKSWGSVPLYKDWDVRLVFLLGNAEPSVNQTVLKDQEKQLKQLLAEEEEYGDLVIGSFIDTYRNLTYKHSMGYKWILTFCPEAPFVLKVDDDMFLDIFKWLDWRTEDFEKLERNGSTRVPDLYCQLNSGSPDRDENLKWFVSKEEWAEDHYPDYCNGWAYSVTRELLQRLYSVANSSNFFWIDDVYVTGKLLGLAQDKYSFKAKVQNIKSLVTFQEKEFCENGTLGATRSFQVLVPVTRGDLFERDMMCMWNKTLYDAALNLTLSQ